MLARCIKSEQFVSSPFVLLPQSAFLDFFPRVIHRICEESMTAFLSKECHTSSNFTNCAEYDTKVLTYASFVALATV